LSYWRKNFALILQYCIKASRSSSDRHRREPD